MAEVRRESEPLFERMLPVIRDERPKTRADCERGPRPCPWVGCRHHLFLDVKEGGYLRYNFPDKELDQLEETCALDVAEDGQRHTLDRVGDLVNMGRDHLARYEARALERVRSLLRSGDAGDDDEGDW